MEEGVKNSRCVIAIVSGPPGDDSAYFRRPFCLAELTWAKDAGVPVVPVVAAEDKGKITEFFADIPTGGADCPSLGVRGLGQPPGDMQFLKSANWEHIDRKDKDYFELGVNKILAAADEAKASGGLAPAAAPAAQLPPVRL